MQSYSNEIVVIIITGTLIMLLLASFVSTFYFILQRRVFRHRQQLDSLRDAHQREILTAQLETQNQTLQHVSDELHDHLGQMLSVVWLNLNLLRDKTDQTPYQSDVAQLLTHTAGMMTDLRSLSKSLSTDTIARYGLAECVRLELERIDRADTPRRAVLDLTGEVYSLGEQTEIVLLRMVQEALNNALKHAYNAPITVTMDYQSDRLTLTIADKGPGFVLDEVAARPREEAGQGLSNLRRRAKLLGGTCTWQTAPGAGTSVVLSIPRLPVQSV